MERNVRVLSSSPLLFSYCYPSARQMSLHLTFAAVVQLLSLSWDCNWRKYLLLAYIFPFSSSLSLFIWLFIFPFIVCFCVPERYHLSQRRRESLLFSPSTSMRMMMMKMMMMFLLGVFSMRASTWIVSINWKIEEESGKELSHFLREYEPDTNVINMQACSSRTRASDHVICHLYVCHTLTARACWENEPPCSHSPLSSYIT